MGVDLFLPVERRWYHRKDRPGQREMRDAVLFDGYLFVNGDDETPHVAKSARHVSTIIPVPNQVRLTRELAAFEQAIAVQQPTTIYRQLIVGRQVRVTGGPMQGVEGTLIIRHDRRQVFILEVTILGAAREMEIDPALLEPKEGPCDDAGATGRRPATWRTDFGRQRVGGPSPEHGATAGRRGDGAGGGATA